MPRKAKIKSINRAHKWKRWYINSVLNSAALDKATSKEIDHRWALPLKIEFLQNIKSAGVVPPRGCITIINEREGGTLHQKKRDS